MVLSSLSFFTGHNLPVLCLTTSLDSNCDGPASTVANHPSPPSPVAQPLVLELDMHSEDINDDTTKPDSNETHLYEYLFSKADTSDITRW